ncbi:DNA polymerase [Paenibacillus sp. OK003]|uniref:DNA polymerase n=1 Tax=Paenibacillus sp. OK003 TaxID=1884380 RepID=UPI0008C871F0|nr:DNA polymerase [Paenibacillus sp. OK003]SEL27992.1 DNA polymerase I-3'-5' exonuclease and polymerase domains [Paenibacillus sp. OK003]
MSDNEVINILTKGEKKSARTTRTRNTEIVKKAKKLTKKEQKILDVEASIVMPDNYTLINTPELLQRLVNYYKAYKTMYQGDAYVYLDTETYGLNNWRDTLISISIGFESEEYFNIPMRPFLHEMSINVECLSFDAVSTALKPLLEEEDMIVMANAKFDIHALKNWADIDITFNIHWDTIIMGSLLNENKPKGLKEWYNSYALPWLIEQGKLSHDELSRPTFRFGSMFDKIPFDSIPHRLANYYACHDVFMTHWVFRYQKSIVENPSFGLDGVYRLFREVEMPLLAVFATAERRGVELDSKFLKDIIGKVLQEKLDELKADIFAVLGGTITLIKSRTRQRQGIKFKEEYEVVEEFNLGSPAQLASKLYVDHKILEAEMVYDKDLKRKVPKLSTSKKVLTRNKKVTVTLGDKTHKIIDYILEYRGLSKLIDAFCNKLPDDTVEGIIHCSYNQLVRTGRVSCSAPNLQQIPSKFDLIRYAFRAPSGRLLVSGDFSQQELRWLAIFTQEQTLIDIFKLGLDMHSRVTCQIHSFDYDMFETIRGYKGDSEEETSINVDEAITKYAGSHELIYAITYMNSKEQGTNSSTTEIVRLTIERLSAFFELLRKKTKSVVFGVIYGITDLGLSDQIESSKEEAKELIDGFKSSMPNYLRWEGTTHKEVMEKGYIETVLGRKRRFGEIIAEAKQEDLWKRSGWHWKIEKCKRQSCNAKIQGSSADQSKKAMVELFYPKRPDGTTCLNRREWVINGYVSQLEKDDIHLVLQVHDELIFDAPETVDLAVLKAITDTMANVIPNDAGVQFKSDIEVSPYWGGNFSQEQIRLMNEGALDWRDIFEEEVKKKLSKFGIEYEVGMFAEKDDEEEEEEAT